MELSATPTSISSSLQKNAAAAADTTTQNSQSMKKSFSVAFIMSDTVSSSSVKSEKDASSNENSEGYKSKNGTGRKRSDQHTYSHSMTSSSSSIADSSLLSTSSCNYSPPCDEHELASKKKRLKLDTDTADHEEDAQPKSASAFKLHSGSPSDLEQHGDKLAKIISKHKNVNRDPVDFQPAKRTSHQMNENEKNGNDSNESVSDYNNSGSSPSPNTSASMLNAGLPSYLLQQLNHENHLSYLKAAAAAAFNNPYMLNLQASQQQKDFHQMLMESNSYLQLQPQMGLLQTVANSYQPSIELQSGANHSSSGSASSSLNLSQSSSMSTPPSAPSHSSTLQMAPLGIGVNSSSNNSQHPQQTANDSSSSSSTNNHSPVSSDQQQHSSKSSIAANGQNSSSSPVIPHWPWIPAGTLPDSSTINAASKLMPNVYGDFFCSYLELYFF